MVLTSAMTGRLEMSCKLLPFRESHERRVVRASTPSAPSQRNKGIETWLHRRRQPPERCPTPPHPAWHIKGDKSTSSSHGQLAARRVSSGGGKRSRWGSTNVAKTIHPHLVFFWAKTAAVFFLLLPDFVLQSVVQRLPQHTSNDPLCCSSRTLAS